MIKCEPKKAYLMVKIKVYFGFIGGISNIDYEIIVFLPSYFRCPFNLIFLQAKMYLVKIMAPLSVTHLSYYRVDFRKVTVFMNNNRTTKDDSRKGHFIDVKGTIAFFNLFL